jgi:DNA modification methylase
MRWPEWISDDGRIRLINADCLEVLPTLPPGLVDCVVTSPPYNLKKKWWDSGANGIHVDLAKKFRDGWYADETPEEVYQQQQRMVLDQSRRLCRGAVCYNHRVRHAFKREGRTFHPIEWTGAADLWCEIIWDRGPGPAVNCRRPTMADERVFVFQRPVAWNDLGYSSIWRFPPNREDIDHPCPFPVEMPLRLIKSFTDENMTIGDWYVGSGTTAVACIRTNRRCIAIEKDRKYFESSIDRIKAEYDRTALFDGACA